MVIWTYNPARRQTFPFPRQIYKEQDMETKKAEGVQGGPVGLTPVGNTPIAPGGPVTNPLNPKPAPAPASGAGGAPAAPSPAKTPMPAPTPKPTSYAPAVGGGLKRAEILSILFKHGVGISKDAACASKHKKKKKTKKAELLRRFVDHVKGAAEKKKDMPPFTRQDRPEKVKDIYRALKREHPDMPAEMKARIAARQGKKGKQKQGPPYKGPLAEKKSDLLKRAKKVLVTASKKVPAKTKKQVAKALGKNMPGFKANPALKTAKLLDGVLTTRSR
jgi:hypothetical protein